MRHPLDNPIVRKEFLEGERIKQEAINGAKKIFYLGAGIIFFYIFSILVFLIFLILTNGK